MTSYWKLYARLYVLIFVLVAALLFALGFVFGLRAPGGLTSILPALIAAMLVGSRYVQDAGVMPEKSDAWRAALWMTGCVVVVHLLIGMGLIVFSEARVLFSGWPPLMLFVLMAVGLGLVLFANRWSVMFGAKSAHKAMQGEAD